MSKSLAQVAHRVFPIFILLWLAGCNGGGDNSAPAGGGTNFTVGGTVSGLSGTVVLQNNTGNDMTLSANNAFSFTTAMATGGNYSVTVRTQPASQTCAVANGAGTVSGANVTDVRVTCSASPPSLALLAGDMQSSGSLNGIGIAARFNAPQGLATDNAGNVYVADTSNSIIRKITPQGVVSTLAGAAGTPGSSDSTDGTGATARFDNPTSVGTDRAGNVYVTETFTVRKVTPEGAVSTLAGTAGARGSNNGTGPAASFAAAYGGGADSAGNVYVVDNACTLRKITPQGVVTFALITADVSDPVVGQLPHDCTGASREVNGPFGVATDSADNIYETHTSWQVVYKMTPAGVLSTLAGTVGVIGSADATGAAASFNRPWGVAADSAGNVYVADTGNHTIRKITPDGAVSTVVGVAGQPGFTPGALPGLLSSPIGVAVSGKSLYITMLNGVAVVRNLP